MIMNIIEMRQVLFEMPEEKDLAERFQKQNNMTEWVKDDESQMYVIFRKTSWINLEDANSERQINPAGTRTEGRVNEHYM